jgi:hypothetical protein
MRVPPDVAGARQNPCPRLARVIKSNSVFALFSETESDFYEELTLSAPERQ